MKKNLFSFFLLAMLGLVFLTTSYAKSSPPLLLLNQHINGHVLDLRSSDLVDQDMPAIIVFLTAHPDITELNLYGNNKLTSIGLIPLANITSLTALNIGRSCWGNCGYGLTGKEIMAFANHPTLTRLNVRWHSIGDDGAMALSKNTVLKELDLTSNNITDEGGMALAKNQVLEKLLLNGNHIGLATAQTLAKNNTLKQLSLSGVIHRAEQASVADNMAVTLAQNTSLTYLDFTDVPVGDLGAIALANHQSLQNLELGSSRTNEKRIGIDGVIALSKNHTLKKLYVYTSDSVSDQGAFAFAANTTLNYLVLGGTRISQAGLEALAKNKNLQTLGLNDCKLGDTGAILLAKEGKHLREVTMVDCELTAKGAQALATMPQLKKLNVTYNDIGDEGAAALAQASNLYGLSELDLMFNHIHDKGAIALAQTKNLKTLNVMLNNISQMGEKALRNNHHIHNLYINHQVLDLYKKQDK